jgi:hypothetical protein
MRQEFVVLLIRAEHVKGPRPEALHLVPRVFLLGSFSCRGLALSPKSPLCFISPTPNGFLLPPSWSIASLFTNSSRAQLFLARVVREPRDGDLILRNCAEVCCNNDASSYARLRSKIVFRTPDSSSSRRSYTLAVIDNCIV